MAKEEEEGVLCYNIRFRGMPSVSLSKLVRELILPIYADVRSNLMRRHHFRRGLNGNLQSNSLMEQSQYHQTNF